MSRSLSAVGEWDHLNGINDDDHNLVAEIVDDGGFRTEVFGRLRFLLVVLLEHA
jgi:hypothetical protein